MWLKIIAIIRSNPEDPRFELIRELEELGATKVVGEHEVDQAGFPDQVKEWTADGREKVRLGLNCIGGKPAMKMSTILTPGAHHVTYGGMSKNAFRASAKSLIFDDIKFTGFWQTRWAEQHPGEKESTIEQILALTRSGKFKTTNFVEIPWNWDTSKAELVKAAADTLRDPYLGKARPGKALLTFGDTGL